MLTALAYINYQQSKKANLASPFKKSLRIFDLQTKSNRSRLSISEETKMKGIEAAVLITFILDSHKSSKFTLMKGDFLSNEHHFRGKNTRK